MECKIGSRCAGMNIRDYIRRELGMSRGQLTVCKQIENGILLNGKSVTVRAVLSEGDVLCLAVDDREMDINPNIVPRALPLSIVYEDDDIIAVNKACGMPTHPSHGHYDDTLANALVSYFGRRGIPFVFRAVNRLDADTGGLVLVAKNRQSAYRLSLQLQKHVIYKRYAAILRGCPIAESGEFSTPIRRKPGSVMEREAGDFPDAVPALTRYRILSHSSEYSLADVMPVTGRTHQIRVHFSHAGTPLAGDWLYDQTLRGNAEKVERMQENTPCEHRQYGVDRFALFAYSLYLRHPSTGDPLLLRASMPAAMDALCRQLGLTPVLPSDEEILRSYITDGN